MSKVAAEENVIRIRQVKVKSSYWRRWGWLALVNTASVVAMLIISGGALAVVAPFVIILGAVAPTFGLFASKWLAKRRFGIQIINPNQFASEEEKWLYKLVENLSVSAGLRKVPEVGIYLSDEVNAFATGSSKNNSLVAFSSTLLEGMDDQAIAAVAAHEIAHVANGDMVTLTTVQIAVNTIITSLMLPLKILEWLVHLVSDSASYWVAKLVGLCNFLISVFLIFLGTLTIKAFSRRREFKADALAARMLNPGAMIHALTTLSEVAAIRDPRHKKYAAFMINSPRRWLDLFSTHPSLERRIKSLNRLKE